MNNWIVIAICLLLIAGIRIRITRKDTPAPESVDAQKVDEVIREIASHAGIETRNMTAAVFDTTSSEWKDLGEVNVTITGVFGDDEYYKMMSAYYEDEIERRRCRSSLVENVPLPPEFEEWLNNLKDGDT